MADTPALPEQLSDEQVQDVIDYGDACGTFSVSLAREVRDLRRASPRREAPADFTAAVEEAWELLDDPAFIAGYLRGLGYQLVPAGHHVSPEGQTVIDGKRWEVEVVSANYDGVPQLKAVLNPPVVRPVGTEEADTDG